MVPYEVDTIVLIRVALGKRQLLATAGISNHIRKLLTRNNFSPPDSESSPTAFLTSPFSNVDHIQEASKHQKILSQLFVPRHAAVDQIIALLLKHELRSSMVISVSAHVSSIVNSKTSVHYRRSMTQ
eukprot:scaffold1867_cov186-Chaetoceros_neogracile.AAC.8